MKELYFSKLLTTKAKYYADWQKIKSILERFEIDYGLIEGTKDIWARDYMPVMDGKGKLVQFTYEPSYLKDDLDRQTNPDEVLIDGKRPTNCGISSKLDGGNYVKKGKKVIISERIFSENNISSKKESESMVFDSEREKKLAKIFEPVFNSAQQKVIHDLEGFLELEVIIFPCYGPEEDFTGHSDGYVRFISEGVVLISKLSEEYKPFAKKMEEVLERYNLDYKEMPCFKHYSKKHPDSAIGCYLNYLELPDLIIFPIFDIKPQLDNDAIKMIKTIFPRKHIEPIIINDIANEGGLMNCISWTKDA